jgi:ABC-type multidrug transport system permease subunit
MTPEFTFPCTFSLVFFSLAEVYGNVEHMERSVITNIFTMERHGGWWWWWWWWCCFCFVVFVVVVGGGGGGGGRRRSRREKRTRKYRGKRGGHTKNT